jgi:hypothetical protein
MSASRKRASFSLLALKRDREAERQRDRETEKQRGRETES